MLIPEHINRVYQRATCIYNKAQVETALDEIAKQIHIELEETNPILLCIMIGGIVLTGNLLPRLDFPLTLDYLHATRYRGEIKGGALDWRVMPTVSLKDRTVLLLDDILDGGLTLASAVDYCKAQGVREVKSAVLLDKLETRLVGGLPHADFTALAVNNGYVFGYGMDYKEYLRNAPGIFVVAREDEG